MIGFSPSEIIKIKRDGGELSPDQIKEFINGIASGQVTDYQATAFLMAVYFRKLTAKETSALTLAMRDSGKKYDLSSVSGIKVDKHSTGGVGDKVSLILAPLAAACGVSVPMMSGRGLGHTGGTLDKLESIPGFNVKLPEHEFIRILKSHGFAMIGQSAEIAPADKKLYALRDVTATVESIDLITASILSKKAAEGAQALVLDVKFGSGAFMKSLADAKKLALSLISVSRLLGIQARALLTDMNQPLGSCVGNALEMQECLEIMTEPANHLNGQNPLTHDLVELTIELTSHMIVLAKKAGNLKAARLLAEQRLLDGSALKKFQAVVREQGGSLPTFKIPYENPNKVIIRAPKSGYLNAFSCGEIGQILIELGGGRKRAEDSVFAEVGIRLLAKTGSKIQKGQTLAEMYFRPAHTNASALNELQTRFLDSILIRTTKPKLGKLVRGAL